MEDGETRVSSDLSGSALTLGGPQAFCGFSERRGGKGPGQRQRGWRSKSSKPAATNPHLPSFTHSLIHQRLGVPVCSAGHWVPGMQGQGPWIHTGVCLPGLETCASDRRQFPAAFAPVFFLLSFYRLLGLFCLLWQGPSLPAPVCAPQHLGKD